MPGRIQKRIDSGETVEGLDGELVRGLEEAKKALEMPPNERRPIDFQEVHELLLTFHGIVDLTDDTDSDDDVDDDKSAESEDATEDEDDSETERNEDEDWT